MKRWLVRSVFILPLLLCLFGWGASGWRAAVMNYARTGLHAECRIEWGIVDVYWERGDIAFLPEGIECYTVPLTEVRFWSTRPGYHLGFALYWNSGFGELAVPYWFLILLFGSVLFLVWRKTRLRKTYGAFPVEMAVKKETA